MLRLIPILLTFFVVSIQAAHNYPGTKTRPILSDSEASSYTKNDYLGGWNPGSISTTQADYTVGNGQQYTSIQQAVNAAIKAGGHTRKYIKVNGGTYSETVYIPSTTVPITIYGAGNSAADVKISLSQSANTAGSTYVNTVGHNYKNGDPGYHIYQSCALRATLGTSCSSVVWIQADDVEITKITFENPSTNGQAVAVQTDGNHIHFDNVQFLGFQDTLYVKGNGRHVYFNNVVVKGDVDFIFGDASAVFENSQLVGRGNRRNSALIFAPSTKPTQKYGYLAFKSHFSADSNVASARGLRLARAWDEGTPAGTYQPGKSPNGQLVIRECTIDGATNSEAPYSSSTGRREFSGNVATNRNLDDNNYNRFWEYKNTGAGA